MAMEAKQIIDLIKKNIPDADVSIEDLRGDGDHYAATISSGSFKGLSKIQQHKLVYNALEGNMGDALHALALKTKEK